MTTDLITEARRPLVAIDLADKVLSLLTTDHPLTLDTLEDRAAGTVWSAVAKRLSAYEGGRHVSRVSVGLQDLHRHLIALMTEIRSHPGPLAGHLDRYNAIRSAQHNLVAAITGRNTEVELPRIGLRIQPGRLLQVTGAISNIDEVWPDWRNSMRGAFYDAPPWDHDQAQPLVIKATEANLLWLADGPALPWVPTLEEAGRAFSEQTAAEEKRLITIDPTPN